MMSIRKYKQKCNLIPPFGGPKSFISYLGLFFLMVIASCKQFIEVPAPRTQTSGSTIYENDASATAALVGIYGRMINTTGFASGSTNSVTFLAALSADECISYSAVVDLHQFYENAINSTNGAIGGGLWNEAYRYIYDANAVLEGLEKSSGVTEATKKQLQGEARFIRAFCHFYLVNLFGDVPFVVTTDYKINSIASRTPKAEVYNEIINDLREAQNLLENNYITTERVRPNKWTVTTLLARVYLYNKDWVNAASQATAVINSGSYNLEDSLNSVFMKNSQEAIWQLMPNLTGLNTFEGNNFILNTIPSISEASSATLSNWLLEAFEVGDLRGKKWVDSIQVDHTAYYFPYKYKIKTGETLKEYSMVLRLAELYLIRAEAYAQRNMVAAARADINKIRKRAGLPASKASTKNQLMSAIAHERQVELFTEWGHRWLDLKRTDQANTVLGAAKPGWQATDMLYPIPQNELLKNTRLTQNLGY